jgi:hypothetical protein
VDDTFMRAASLGFPYQRSKEPTLARVVDRRVSASAPWERQCRTEEGDDGCCNGREEDEAAVVAAWVWRGGWVPDEEGFGF